MSLLDRFLRYVKVETTAVEDADSYPSSPGQLVLGRMLAAELKELGLQGVRHSDDGIVIATIPATAGGAPTIAWFAHLDTSPETTAAGVSPLVHEDYDGGDIMLPGDPDKVIRVAETPALARLQGKTLITTDGTTLLGADDKAGVAVIVTAAERLMNDADLAHGPIRVVFTCDEEIGRGTDKVDIDELGAICGYTLDGDAAAKIENETFSADLAIVRVNGRNIHPGLATGRLINALRLAAKFIDRLPSHFLAPETTAVRQGFIHPYVVTGGVARVSIRLLLRSFHTPELDRQAALLRAIADTVTAGYPGSTITIERIFQYRNMAEFLDKEPRAVELAVQAMHNLGVEPRFASVRGGTDGSRFSEKGLPTPNLSVGMYNFHSPLEFACLEEMAAAVDVLVELARLWGQERV